MKEGTLHDSHMLVYADAAFPVLHLSVVWRCSCRSSRKARLSQHRLESPSKSLRQPLSAQQTLRQPLSCFSEVDRKGGELMQCRGCGRRLAWEGRREDARRTNTWPGENCETHENLVGSKSSWAGRDFASFLLCWLKISIWKSLHQNCLVIEGDRFQVNISSWWFMDCLLFSDQRLKTFHRIFCWSDKVSLFFSQVVLYVDIQKQPQFYLCWWLSLQDSCGSCHFAACWLLRAVDNRDLSSPYLFHTAHGFWNVNPCRKVL